MKYICPTCHPLLTWQGAAVAGCRIEFCIKHGAEELYRELRAELEAHSGSHMKVREEVGVV